MDSRYVVLPARPEHLPVLGEVERAAGSLFVGRVPEVVLADSTSPREFRDAQAAGRLFVGLLDDTPVGFALVEDLAPDLFHLEEMDVHPEHGRRGVGARLLDAVVRAAAARRRDWVTLTTYDDVAWNRPFYQKNGFEVVSPDWRDELRRRMEEEATRGLEAERRVVMRRRAQAPTA